ncbi:MAG: hypothetical protein UW11_C0023G0013 [Parcubacteria group bacterium GW2011_GWA2_43_9b]|uniref:Sulfotransferase domain-containing protein n=1 Tax=Candidatus Portnoybacteria bacterium RIFCSPLOWO2_02_FULL_39_11 TaxID=1802001 RepID=A0A1G2FSD5_9BACT|nr:MAG: hypothetical protein UW11_C0023G0013 [Parcubacteria group bacterium GW2011_GWA2_43_9b]OGZ40451.1 MAG: hypothetical protein A3B04_02350 [Candidatus Portnoybacteria bacterium RIFCSPLOWO2_02_FULL_39_11]
MPAKAKKFIMISAMYENGGNTTQRLLDGHAGLMVYPFESQLGSKYVNDHLSGLFPLKYRWPIFPNFFSAEAIYRSIIDEECKIRAITPSISKFKDVDFNFSDQDRLAFFVKELKGTPLTRAKIIRAFFKATFLAWKNFKHSGREKYYVGYSPIIAVDGREIVADFDGQAYVIHVVRNPFSAYADTQKRPVPLSINHYMTAWAVCQHYAGIYQKKYPDNFFIVKYEDIIVSPQKALEPIFSKLGLALTDSLNYPSWNGQRLKQVYPWGTIKIPTERINIATARELNGPEIEEINLRSGHWLEYFGYDKIYQLLK